MALQEILESLRRDGEAEVARIAREHDEAVAAILHAAREEAKRAETEATTARDEALEFEAAIIRHRAELHVERRLQEAQEAVFQEVLGRAKDRLSRFRNDPAYPATLQRLLDECRAFLGQVAGVSIDPRDEALKSVIGERLGSVAVDTGLDSWGGVVADDGRGVFVRNTFEARLTRAEAELRRQIGELVPGLGGRAEPGSSP